MIYVLDAVESFSFLTHGTVWSRQMNSLSFYWVRGTCNNLIPLSLSLSLSTADIKESAIVRRQTNCILQLRRCCVKNGGRSNKFE